MKKKNEKKNFFFSILPPAVSWSLHSKFPVCKFQKDKPPLVSETTMLAFEQHNNFSTFKSFCCIGWTFSSRLSTSQTLIVLPADEEMNIFWCLESRAFMAKIRPVWAVKDLKIRIIFHKNYIQVHDVYYQLKVCSMKKLLMKLFSKRYFTLGGTRTPNPRFRRPMPYPLGHEGRYLFQQSIKFYEVHQTTSFAKIPWVCKIRDLTEFRQKILCNWISALVA